MGDVGGRTGRGGEGKEGEGGEFFFNRAPKSILVSARWVRAEEGDSKISGTLEAEEPVVLFASISHQREQFLDQPGLQLSGEVGTLGAKGAGGGTRGEGRDRRGRWPLPPGGLQRAPSPSLHHPQGRGSFQPFTCDDKSQSGACRGAARLHLPFPLGILGLWLRGFLKTAPS